MPRRKMHPDERCDVKIQSYLRPPERAQLLEKAQQLGVSEAALIRLVVLNYLGWGKHGE